MDRQKDPLCLSEHDVELLGRVMQLTSDGIVVTDDAQRIIFFNKGAERIFGHPRRAVLGQPLSMLLPIRYRARHEELVAGFRDSGIGSRMMSERVEIQGIRSDGVEFPAEVSVSRIELERRRCLAAIVRDVSRRKSLELQLKESIRKLERLERRSRHQALHDPLTGLPNRAHFQQSLEDTLRDAGRIGGAALLFLDLDNFKAVNDALGHPAGDALLCHVARRLSASLRGGDRVGRLGGDEFTVILPGADRCAALGAARRILDMLESPFEIDGSQVMITASIGIALYPTDADDMSGLMRAADTAMYRAKSGGGNGVVFFLDGEAAQDAAQDAAR